MTTTSVAEFTIVLTAAQAQAELDRTKTAALSLGGGLDRVVDSEKRLQALWAGAPNLYAKVSSGFFDMENAAKRLKGQLGPQAAALSMVSAALGETAGEAGKAISAAGQLASAWASGGPLGVSTVALTYSVGLLVDHWRDLNEEQSKAVDREFAGTDASSAKLRAAQDANRAIRDQLSEQGLTSKEKQLAATNREISALQAQVDGMRQAGKIWTENEIKTRDQLNQTIRLLRERQRLIALLPDESPDSPGGGRSSPGLKEESGWERIKRERQDAYEAQHTKDLAALKMQQDEIDMILDAKHDARMEREREATRMQAEEERERTRFLAEQEKERARIEQDAAREKEARMRQVGDTVASIGAGAAQTLTNAIVTGQKDAAAQTAIYVMGNAGTALIGSGLKLAGESVMSALTPGGQPLAVAQAAGASALIGGGVALGGAAAWLGKAGAVSQMAGVKAARADGGIGTGEGGFGRRSRQRTGSEGNGTTQIVNVWGVSGPQAEDQARRTAYDLRVADRRRLRGRR